MPSLFQHTDFSSFMGDYLSARHHFLNQHTRISQNLRQSHDSFKHPLTGPQGEALYCDSIFLGQRPNPDSVLVLISATHGIEGFAGSAIQCDILAKLSPVLQQHAELGVLLIHALNPWGFAWLRRYDHQGIDLNRNFIDFEQPLPDNADFDRHLSVLDNPEVLIENTVSRLWQGSGSAAFADEVTRGQYKHENQCFFGGTSPAWSRITLEQIIQLPALQQASRLAVIDLHTGLGPYGYGEVINDHLPDSPGFDLVSAWYGDNAQSSFLGTSCSGIKTGLLDYHWHHILGERGCFVTLEFGTYPLQQFWLSLLSEQHYHNRLASCAFRDLNHPAVTALKKFFYPDELSWKEQVLFRGRQVCRLALQGILR